MPGELLRNVAAASIIGCVGMLFVRKGAQREIMRVAVGILIILSSILPLIGEKSYGEFISVFRDSMTIDLREEKEEIYWEALEDTTENMVSDYFRQKGMQVESRIEIDQNNVEHIILYPKDAHEWTQEDAAAFDRWSGIEREKQEWIWN